MIRDSSSPDDGPMLAHNQLEPPVPAFRTPRMPTPAQTQIAPAVRGFRPPPNCMLTG
jgi:hypothetical protein